MMSEEEERTAEEMVWEPLSAYKTQYQGAFRRNCEDYFDDLVKKSGVDLAENGRIVAAYEAQNRLVAEADRLLSRDKMWRVFLIIWIVAGAVCAVASIPFLLDENLLPGVLMCVLGAVSVVAAVVLLVKCVLPRLRKNEEKKKELQKKADELYRQAWQQMAPLNALFENNVTGKLIEKTVSIVQLDENFNIRRYDYLSEKYGYGGEDDPAASTIGILTGEISGNPFVADRVLVCTMGTETYTGSITIYWETHHTDSEGRVVTTHHSQTLTASVTRPKPFYSQRTRLIYGNEAAPDLHFSRRPSHVEDDSEKERSRKVKRGMKKVRRKQQDAMEKGGSFTEMGNDEFEVLFGALDRDNEVQFRLLFTPLAQKNMLALLKDAEGYGDDFYMRKSGCLNYIVSEHSAQWDMEEAAERYCSYSAELARSKFLQFNEQYFRSLYFDLAPLLSIPLYQQHKPHEYIYKEVYPRYFTRQETEYAVNRLDINALASPYAATPSILKTRFLEKDGRSDRVCVRANAFNAVPRTEYVSVFGGDGMSHMVPVDWTEYIPVYADTVVEMKELGLTEREFQTEAAGAFRSALEKHGKAAYGYRHGILCCVVPEGATDFDADFTIKK